MMIEAAACSKAVDGRDIRGGRYTHRHSRFIVTMHFASCSARPSILDDASAAGASSPRLHISVTPGWRQLTVQALVSIVGH